MTDKSPGSGERELPQRTSSQISKSIDRQNSIEEILRLLPRKECGACGCPDCATLAEDVVNGRASLQSCMFLRAYPDFSKRY